MSTLSGHPELKLDRSMLNDLTDLPAEACVGADELFSILRTRFDEGLIVTQISPRVLVALNPFQLTESHGVAAHTDWSAEYADCGAEGLRGRLGPHLWSISSKAYYYMRRTGQDQTIVLR